MKKTPPARAGTRQMPAGTAAGRANHPSRMAGRGDPGMMGGGRNGGMMGGGGGSGMMGGRGGMEGMGGMMGGGKENAPARPAQQAPGWNVYVQNNCASCHRIGGKGGTVGPDLSHEGKKHNAAWIETQVANPKAHSPNTMMPAFKLNRKDLSALGKYLASLK